MVCFAALFPGRNFGGVGLSVVVVTSSMQPVTVAVNMELFQVTEFVLWMVFQIVGHDLLVVCGLWLVSEPIKGCYPSAFKRHLELWINLDAGSFLNRCHSIGAHKCFHQHFYNN